MAQDIGQRRRRGKNPALTPYHRVETQINPTSIATGTKALTKAKARTDKERHKANQLAEKLGLPPDYWRKASRKV